MSVYPVRCLTTYRSPPLSDGLSALLPPQEATWHDAWALSTDLRRPLPDLVADKLCSEITGGGFVVGDRAADRA